MLELLPPHWLVKGMVPENGLAVVFGDSNVGKTFAVIDLVMSVASGRPWQGRTTHPAEVIYVSPDGASRVQGRFAAWTAKYGLPLNKVAVWREPIDLRQPSDVERLVAQAREAGFTRPVIVVDTLARSIGAGNENNADDMGAFLLGLDRLREAFPGATAIVIHHVGHADKNRARGHSALIGAADTVIAVRPARAGGADPDIAGRMVFVCEKQRDAAKFAPISLRLRVVPIRQPGGGSATSCIVEADDGDEDDPALSTWKPLRALDGLTPNDLRALEELERAGPQGLRYGEWKARLGWRSDDTMSKARKRLEGRGKLVRRNGRYVAVTAEMGRSAEHSAE